MESEDDSYQFIRCYILIGIGFVSINTYVIYYELKTGIDSQSNSFMICVSASLQILNISIILSKLSHIFTFSIVRLFKIKHKTVPLIIYLCSCVVSIILLILLTMALFDSLWFFCNWLDAYYIEFHCFQLICLQLIVFVDTIITNWWTQFYARN